MKPLRVINQRIVDISLYRRFSHFDVGDEGAHVRLLDGKVSTPTHATNDDDFAVLNRLKHLTMFVIRVFVHTVLMLLMFVKLLGSLRELLVTGFRPLFCSTISPASTVKTR